MARGKAAKRAAGRSLGGQPGSSAKRDRRSVTHVRFLWEPANCFSEEAASLEQEKTAHLLADPRTIECEYTLRDTDGQHSHYKFVGRVFTNGRAAVPSLPGVWRNRGLLGLTEFEWVSVSPPTITNEGSTEVGHWSIWRPHPVGPNAPPAAAAAAGAGMQEMETAAGAGAAAEQASHHPAAAAAQPHPLFPAVRQGMGAEAMARKRPRLLPAVDETGIAGLGARVAGINWLDTGHPAGAGLPVLLPDPMDIEHGGTLAEGSSHGASVMARPGEGTAAPHR